MSETKEPRKLEEIQKEYNDMCARAGQAQYQIKVITEELNGINQKLLELNREGAERHALDSAKAGTNG